MTHVVHLDGLMPSSLSVASTKIILDSYEIAADIGFHDFEIGSPQRLLVTVEIWLDSNVAPADDDPVRAWNYDLLRKEVEAIAGAKRYNLQETLAHAIYERVAERRGVRALRVATSKPDVYAKARGVGVEIASFPGASPIA
jgi:dihydroneopterin aldolase